MSYNRLFEQQSQNKTNPLAQSFFKRIIVVVVDVVVIIVFIIINLSPHVRRLLLLTFHSNILKHAN